MCAIYITGGACLFAKVKIVCVCQGHLNTEAIARRIQIASNQIEIMIQKHTYVCVLKD